MSLASDLVAQVGVEPRPVPHAMIVPAQLHGPVLQVLETLGVPTFAPDPPSSPKAGVVFLLDDSDYIIADDFEVDIPEFTHDSAWFAPKGGMSDAS